MKTNIVDLMANLHKSQMDKLGTPGERLAYEHGVLYAGQFLDDAHMPKGSKTSLGAADILACVQQMLQDREITEAEAEMILKKYRHKFAPAGRAILDNYRLAQQTMARVNTPAKVEPKP